MKFKTILNFFIPNKQISEEKTPLNLGKLHASLDTAKTYLQVKVSNLLGTPELEWALCKKDSYTDYPKIILSNIITTHNSLESFQRFTSSLLKVDNKDKLDIIRTIQNFENNILSNEAIKSSKELLNKYHKEKEISNRYLTIIDSFVSTNNIEVNTFIESISYLTENNLINEKEQTNITLHLSQLKTLSHNIKSNILNIHELNNHLDSLKNRIDLFTLDNSSSQTINSSKKP